MSKIFNHTVQPLGSTTSPVEDLSLEVEVAFEKLEDILDTSNSTITSVSKAIGNPLFESLSQHKINMQLEESHTLNYNQSSVILKNAPDSSDISVSFQDPLTLATTSLTQIPALNDFTNKNQFKIKGKVLELNVRVSKTSALVLNVLYRTETFSLNNSKFLPNVLKKKNGSFLLTPIQVTGNSFYLDFETNIGDNLSDYILNSQEKISFFYTTDGEIFSNLEVDTYSVDSNKVTFETSDLELTLNPSILCYVNNVSISEVLNALYAEFKTHSHSNNDQTTNISVSTLVNRFVNTDKINYKNGDVTNYQFPQYFNREGYNETLDSVYENSILGTVFLSKKISDTTQSYKGLDKDSNKIVFGDPYTGPKLGYNSSDEGLTVESNPNLNGLIIKSTSETKAHLKINETELTSNKLSFKVKPQGGVFSVVSSDPMTKYTFKFDNSESKGLSSLDFIQTKSLKINDVELKQDKDLKSLFVTSKDPNAKLILDAKVEAKDLLVKNLEVSEAFKIDTIASDKISLGLISSLKTAEGVDVVDESLDKNLKISYKLPTKFTESFIQTLTVDEVLPSKITLGSITLNKNLSPGVNPGVTVKTSEALGDIFFEADARFNKFSGELAEIKKVLADSLGIGDIKLAKNLEGNLEITSNTESSKVIFKSPVEISNLTSTIGGSISLERLATKFLELGNHTFEVQPNGDVAVSPSESNVQSLITFNSNLKVNSIEPTLIQGEEASGVIKNLESMNLKVGSSTLTKDLEGNLSVNPENILTDKLKVYTDTEILKASVIELNSESAVTDKLQIGDIQFSKNSDDTGVTVKANGASEISIDATTIFKDLKATQLNSNVTLTEELQIGSAIFKKNGLNSTITVGSLPEVLDTTLDIGIPTLLNQVVIKNLSSLNEAVFEKLKTSELNLNSLKFKKELDSEDVELYDSSDTDRKLKIKSKLEVSNLVAEIFSTANFILKPDDSIKINDTTYLSAKDSKFTFVTDKSLDIVGSSRSSGLSFTNSLTANNTGIKQYLANNSGTAAVDSEQNAFMELDTSDGIFLLKPTNKQIIKDAISYGFNDPLAQKNVSDLRQWFRADLAAGDVSVDSLNVSVSSRGFKNGISIGDTKLSVIGPDTECPVGLTLLESLDGVHIIKPRNADQNDCKSLTYQEISVASANINGELTVDGNATITESVLVNGAVAAEELYASGNSEVNKLNVLGDLHVSGGSDFSGAVSFKDSVVLKGSLESSGNFSVKTLEVVSDSFLRRDLRVSGNVEFEKDLSLKGGLNLNSGINSNGVLKSNGLITTEISGESLSLLGNASISGDTTLQGKLEVKSSSSIQGSLKVTNSLDVTESISTDNFFTLKDATIGGTLRVKGVVELESRNINIGTDSSLVQLNGKLQFNTKDVTFNSPVKIFNTLRITDNMEVSGLIENKGGIKTDSSFEAKGSISTDSSIESKSGISAKTVNVAQNLDVGNSIKANNITSESIAISGTASVSNLTISKSLSMPVDTSIVAGSVKFSSISQTDSGAFNNFSGELSVAKNVEMMSNVHVGQNLIFNSGDLTISSGGIKGEDAKINVQTLTAYEVRGKEKIQPPVELSNSSDNGAKALSGLISQRDFLRLDHIVSEGISVFNQPLIANTIYYNDLIFIGDDDKKTGAVNILARRALYA